MSLEEWRAYRPLLVAEQTDGTVCGWTAFPVAEGLTVIVTHFAEGLHMNTYTARLMQDSGIQGPQFTYSAADDAEAAREAREWARGQVGHPWDRLTVTSHCEQRGYEVRQA